MGKVVRNNLRIRLDDIVSIHKYQTIPVGNRVHILPFEDNIEGIYILKIKNYFFCIFLFCIIAPINESNEEVPIKVKQTII